MNINAHAAAVAVIKWAKESAQRAIASLAVLAAKDTKVPLRFITHAAECDAGRIWPFRAFRVKVGRGVRVDGPSLTK